ncbi:MAG: hypothetical protein IJ688_13510 [Treponema sp.]|nr:hypothetical protein [Treponema sp.]
MKKSAVLFISILIFLISSCSVKNAEEKGAPFQSVEKFIFELNSAVINENIKQKDADRYYMPQALSALISRKVSENGKVFYLGESGYSIISLGLIDSQGFYDANAENTDWIDSCLARVEEERIASQLSLMEEEFELPVEEEMLASATGDSASQDVASQASAQTDSDFLISDAPSKDISGKNKRLSFSEFEKEKFISQEKDGKHILIYACSENVLRRFYDEKYKLEKEEIWSIKNAENSNLEKTIEYVYDSSGLLNQRLINQNNSQEIYYYTKEGLISKKEVYDILEDDKKLTVSFERRYNELNQLVSELSLTYSASDSYEQRYDYTYNAEDIPPDVKYYEDGVLKMHNKYSMEKGSYTSQIYFDENYSVKTYYQDNKKVREVFFINGEVRREKEYE